MLTAFHKKDRIRQYPNSTIRPTLCGGIIILLYLFLATIDFYWQDLEIPWLAHATDQSVK